MATLHSPLSHSHWPTCPSFSKAPPRKATPYRSLRVLFPRQKRDTFLTLIGPDIYPLLPTPAPSSTYHVTPLPSSRHAPLRPQRPTATRADMDTCRSPSLLYNLLGFPSSFLVSAIILLIINNNINRRRDEKTDSVVTMEVMRYGGGYRDSADVAWRVGRIMLKYRPIAPKPVSGGNVTAPVETKSSSGRGKRKGGLKEGKRGRKCSKKAPVTTEAGAFREEEKVYPVVTLPLMPVTPERKEYSPVEGAPSPTGSDGHVHASCFSSPTWQKKVGATTSSGSSSNSGGLVAPRPVRPVGSWVTVECVTDTWPYQGDISPVNMAVLEKDTCPIFISDHSSDRVTWTNAAYKRMVAGPTEVDDEDEVMRVALITGGLVPEGVTCFTCRVRVRYACRKRGKVSMAAPCDVWRLADGRLTWRLDVKAALSLGLGC